MGIGRRQQNFGFGGHEQQSQYGMQGSPEIQSDGSSLADQLAQLQGQFEWEVNNKDGRIRELQNRLNRLEIEKAQLQSQWERDRQGMMHQLNVYVAAMERYGIPMDDPAAPNGNAENISNGYGSDRAGGTSLDSKMAQLNSLLNTGERARLFDQGDRGVSERPSMEMQGKPNGSIASTLQAMFPHATIRTGQTEGQSGGSDGPAKGDVMLHDPTLAREVDALAGRIQEVAGPLDQRAMKAMQGLNLEGQKEALGLLQEMVDAQGGVCRNVSAMLQSICRKIEKKVLKTEKEGDVQNGWDPGGADVPRRYEGEHDAFEEEDSVGMKRMVDNLTEDDKVHHSSSPVKNRANGRL